MRICVVGGRLQGLEAVYLAQQAGFEVVLVDKDRFAPASSLVDEFYHMDLLSERDPVISFLKDFDLIIPATENNKILGWLHEAARQCQLPLAFHLPSYSISSSKIKSNHLFEYAGIPVPQPWPGCGFPAVVKPSNLSGSAGVVKVTDHSQLEAAVANLHGEVVIQEYLNGPSYSLEVLAHKGTCAFFQITKLEFDSGHDCKRVIAGPATGNDVAETFYDLGERIATTLVLSGIMDIEVINTGKGLSVLEIDARLPSQTPSVVYHSTGVNMVKLLADYWIKGILPACRRQTGVKRAVIYEHFKFRRGVLEVTGEHILAYARDLQVYQNMFSANVFISNFERSPEDWVATAIFVEDTEARAWESRNRAVRRIQQVFKPKIFLDPSPLD